MPVSTEGSPRSLPPLFGEGLPSVPSAGPDRHRTAPLPRSCASFMATRAFVTANGSGVTVRVSGPSKTRQQVHARFQSAGTGYLSCPGTTPWPGSHGRRPSMAVWPVAAACSRHSYARTAGGHVRKLPSGKWQLRNVRSQEPLEGTARPDRHARGLLRHRVRRAAGVGHDEAVASSGERVRLVIEPATDRDDDYGRLLRYVVRASDNLNVNTRLVAVGAAAPYFYAGRRGTFANGLEALAMRASEEARAVEGVSAYGV